MHRLKRKNFLLSLALISAAFCFQSLSNTQEKTPVKDLKDYIEAASKSYQTKDYPGLVENIKIALTLRPTHQTYMYYLVKGYALTGKKAEALQLLSDAVNMGLVYRAAQDKDLDSIKDDPEFKTILAKIENNKAHIGTSELGFTVHEKAFIGEGVDYDPVDEAFYVSSVYKRKIVKIDKKGTATDFAANQDELWSALGIKIDAKRRWLWVATSAHSRMVNFNKEDDGRTAVLKYDLKTGKLIKRYDLSNKPKHHLFGDLTINSRGDVYVTDSIAPEIYVIHLDKDQLELFLESDDFVSPQGIAFSEDGNRLFMADYSKGIFVIDTNTKKFVNIPAAPKTTMLGIDGIYFYKGSLIASQNGVNPVRIVRIYLNKDFSAVDKFEVVEANNTLFGEPTLGAIVKDTFYYNANSLWDDSNGQPPPMDKDHTILKVRL